MLTEEHVDDAGMRTIEDWIGEGIDIMFLPHRHRLAFLRRIGPQLGLMFTLVALVIGLSATGENGSGTALLTTLGPALITTAIGSACVVFIGAVESALEWSVETAEHEIVASFRTIRFEMEKIDQQEVA